MFLPRGIAPTDQILYFVAGQCLKNQPCKVIKMRDIPSLFLWVFFPTSPLIPLIFYDVTWLIFETPCPATLLFFL